MRRLLSLCDTLRFVRMLGTHSTLSFQATCGQAVKQLPPSSTDLY